MRDVFNNDPKLLEILRKASAEGSPLPPQDRAYLGELLAEAKAQADAGAPRLLWSMIQQQGARFRGCHWLPEFNLDLPSSAALLERAGAAGPFDLPLQRWLARVSPARLQASIEHHLGAHDLSSSEYAEAALLAGLAGFSALAPRLSKELRRALSSKSYQEDQAGGVDALLIALNMLGQEKISSIGELSKSPRGALERSIVRAALLAPHVRDPEARAEVAGLLDGPEHFCVELLDAFPREVVEMCADHEPLRQHVRAYLDGETSRTRAMALAHFVVKLGRVDDLRDAIGGSNDELRRALFVEAGLARWQEALEPIRAWLDDNSGDDGAFNASAAVGQIEGDAAWLADSSGSESDSLRGGAILACAGRPELRWLLMQRGTGGSNQPNYLARLLLAAPLSEGYPTHSIARHWDFSEISDFWTNLHVSRTLAQQHACCGWMVTLCLAHHGEWRGDLHDAIKAYSEWAPYFGATIKSERGQAVFDAVTTITPSRLIQYDIEDRLHDEASNDVASRLIAQLRCAGGGLTEVVEARTRHLLGEPPRRSPQEYSMLLSLLPGIGNDDAALERLIQAAPDDLVEPLLVRAMLSPSTSKEVASKATQRALSLASPRHPWLAALPPLARGEYERFDDIPLFLFYTYTTELHARLIDALRREERLSHHHRGSLIWLLDVADADAAVPALQLLAEREGREPWFPGLLLDVSFWEGWRFRQAGANLLEKYGTLAHLYRLFLMLKDDDVDVREASTSALRAVLERHPPRGLYLSAASRTDSVRRWFGQPRPDDFSDEKKAVAEAWVAGIQQAASAAEVKRLSGRKLTLEKPRLEERPEAGALEALARLAEAPPRVDRPVSLGDLEKIAAHLKITSLDKKKGFIEAEVCPRPQGASTRRLLQDFFWIDGTIIAFHATWGPGASE